MGTKARLAGVADGSGIGIVGSGRGAGVSVGISAALVGDRALPSIAHAASTMTTVNRTSIPTRLFTLLLIVRLLPRQ